MELSRKNPLLGLLCVAAVTLFCLSTSVVVGEETTLPPTEIRPITFYLNIHDQNTVAKEIICHGWRCPDFTVVRDPSQLVQERIYLPFDIVVAKADGCRNFSEALMEGYMKLFSYRKGNNSQHINVPMSVPVFVNVTKDSAAHCGKIIEVWFYVNETELTNGIPLPLGENMEIRKGTPSLDVYVGTFRGFIEDSEPSLSILKENMNKDLPYDEDEYIVAMYNNPWTPNGRRNEVWLKAKNKQ